MLSFRIWRALRSPPLEHPIFKHTLLRRLHRARRSGLWLGLLLLGCAASYGLDYAWPNILALLYSASAGLFLGAVVLAVVVLNAGLAALVCSAIARAREQGFYDLLGITPVGTMAATWVMCAATLHRSSLFRWFHFGLTLVAYSLTLALVIALVIPLFFLLLGEANNVQQSIFFGQVFADVAFPLALTVIFYIDSSQSLVLAALVGMFAPVYLSNTSGARLWATSVFVLSQLAAYFMGVLVVTFSAYLHLLGIAAQTLPLIWGGLTMFALREAINTTLWRALTRRLHVEAEGQGVFGRL